MKVKIYSVNGKKKPELIHIETRKYNRYILIGNLIPKLNDLKVYKDNTQLDRKFKIKHGTKWELAKRLNKK